MLHSLKLLEKVETKYSFGDTTRVCTVSTSDTTQQVPVAGKIFSISPYTETEHISNMIHFLQQSLKVLEASHIAYRH